MDFFWTTSVGYAKLWRWLKTRSLEIFLFHALWDFLQDGMDDPDITEAELPETQSIWGDIRTLASPCWSACHKQRHSTIRCERKHHQPNKYKLPLQNFNKKFVKTSWLLQMIILPNSSYSSEASPEIIGAEPIGGPLGLLHRLCSRLPQPKHPHLRPDGESGLSIFRFNFIKSF